MAYSKSSIQKQGSETRQPFSGANAARTMPAVPVLQNKVPEEEALPLQDTLAALPMHTPEAKPVQAKPDNTGIPDGLNSGLEHLTDLSIDEVKGHYKTDKPIQLQEKHPSHEKKLIHKTPSAGVRQLGGEVKAVGNILNAKGVNGGTARRGNRRGSIINTNNDSFLRESAFRQYIGEKGKSLIADIIPMANELKITKQSVEENSDLIIGWTARLCEIGNCGEFSYMVVEELSRNTNNQWLHTCMITNPNKGDMHQFVITNPEQIKNGSIPADIKLDNAVVVDAWDGYKIMTLDQFLNKGNVYKRKYTSADVKVIESREAKKNDNIAQIKPILKNYSKGFDQWYEKNRQDVFLAMLKIRNDLKVDSFIDMPNIYDIQGSDIKAPQDLREIPSPATNGSKAFAPATAITATATTSAESKSDVSAVSTSSATTAIAPTSVTPTSLTQSAPSALISTSSVPATHTDTSPSTSTTVPKEVSGGESKATDTDKDSGKHGSCCVIQ